MRRRLMVAALVAPLALPGCAVIQPNQDNILACSAALIATGSYDPAILGATVLATPACQALAAAAIQELIDLVATKNAARRGVLLR